MATQSSQAWSLSAYLSNTQRQIQRVSQISYVDGGQATIQLPQTGLGIRKWLSIDGVINVNAATITGGRWSAWPNPAPFSIIKNLMLSSNQSVTLENFDLWSGVNWARNRYGRDPNSPYAPSLSATNWNAVGGNNAIVPGANVLAGTYDFSICIPLDMAFNWKLVAGLVNQQYPATIFLDKYVFGSIVSGISATGGSNDFFNNLTGTGISITASVEITLDEEICTYNPNPQFMPQTGLAMTVNGVSPYPQTPIFGAENIIQLPQNDVYTMIMLETWNNGQPLPASDIVSAKLMYGGAQTVTDLTYDTMLSKQYWHNGVLPCDGWIVFDLSNLSGNGQLRDFYDNFNSNGATGFQLRVTFSGGIVASSPGFRLVTENLRQVNQNQ